MIVLLLFLSCTAANGDEDNFPTYEYVQIFQSIPALFEYLLDVVEQRPEILETDDITVFNRNQGKDTREKRSYVDKNRNDNDEIRAGDATHIDLGNEKGIETADAIANKDSSSDINIENSEFDMNEPLKRVVDKESIKPSSAADGDKINTSKNNEENQMDGTYIGFNSLFRLDYQPEDVVEQIIRINELLESHNNKKD